jgi:hypothetical protein
LLETSTESETIEVHLPALTLLKVSRLGQDRALLGIVKIALRVSQHLLAVV